MARPLCVFDLVKGLITVLGRADGFAGRQITTRSGTRARCLCGARTMLDAVAGREHFKASMSWAKGRSGHRYPAKADTPADRADARKLPMAQGNRALAGQSIVALTPAAYRDVARWIFADTSPEGRSCGVGTRLLPMQRERFHPGYSASCRGNPVPVSRPFDPPCTKFLPPSAPANAILARALDFALSECEPAGSEADGQKYNPILACVAPCVLG